MKLQRCYQELEFLGAGVVYFMYKGLLLVSSIKKLEDIRVNRIMYEVRNQQKKVNGNYQCP